MLGLVNADGNIQVFEDDGHVATRLDANVYPVGSDVSARYEHPQGIVLTPEDAKKVGVHLED